MKKQKKSYADLAKAIINKYKKRLGDNFERSDKMAEAALQAELDALAERQEMAKQAQAENEYREMCKGGKLPKMDGLSYLTGFLTKEQNPFVQPLDNSNMFKGFRQRLPTFRHYGENKIFQGYIYPSEQYYGSIPVIADNVNDNLTGGRMWDVSGTESRRILNMNETEKLNELERISKVPDRHPINKIVPKQSDYLNTLFNSSNIGKYPSEMLKIDNTTTKQKSNSWWSQIPTESKIGMGAQLAGVLGQGIIAATAGKPEELKYQDISIPEPELIRNDEQLAAATRAYRGAQNNLRYLSPSQYMPAMSDLATREAATKAGIIEGTANQNAEIRNRSNWQQYTAQRDNATNRLSVDQYNEAMRQNYIGNIGQMVGNVAGVAAGALKDESARKMQNSMMGFMSQANYGSKTIKGRTVATQKLGGLETYVDPTNNQRVWEEFGTPITEQQFMQKVNEHYKRLNP